ncbi:MAG: hypothetical protein GF309_03770 [Candidatus Lokiarchaeota archaeon]|nr:hypothetical protein [Candidatus Lokiarchaeota archaeon]
MTETKTIPLSKEAHNRLKRYGRRGESCEEVIRRLLEIAEQVEFSEKQKKILAEEGFVPLY